MQAKAEVLLRLNYKNCTANFLASQEQTLQTANFAKQKLQNAQIVNAVLGEIANTQQVENVYCKVFSVFETLLITQTKFPNAKLIYLLSNYAVCSGISQYFEAML